MQASAHALTCRRAIPRRGPAFDAHFTPLVADGLRQHRYLTEIADDLALNRKSVSRLARKAGFTDQDIAIIWSRRRGRQPTEESERACRLYRDRGLSTRDVAIALALPLARVRSYLADAGLYRHNSEAVMTARNNPMTARGAERLRITAEVVRLRVGGATFSTIAAAVGRSNRGVRFLLRSPYGQARLACCYGQAPYPERRRLARLMSERQALPAWFIARAVDVDLATVESWLTRRQTRAAA